MPPAVGAGDDVRHRLDDRRVARLAGDAEVLGQVEGTDEDEIEAGDGEDRVDGGEPVGSLDLGADDDVGLDALPIRR